MNLHHLQTATLLTAAVLGVSAGPATAATLTFDFLQIAKTGDAVPGTGGTFTGSFSDPSADDAGNVAFHADTTVAGFDEGTYAFKNGTLVRIMDEQNPLPGLTTTIDGLDDHVEIRSGTAAFVGDVAPGNDDAIAVSDGTTTRVVVQEGVTVLPSTGSPVVDGMSNSEGFGFDGTRLAFQARYSGGEGVYMDDGAGNITRIADTDDTAPGGAAFISFGNAMPDAHGPGVAFSGNTASGSGIYVSDSGVVTELAATADFPPVTPAVDFISIGEPDIDAGRVAFSTLQFDFDEPFDTPGRTPGASVEFWDNGTLTTIADQDTVLPGGGTTISFAEVGIAGDFVAFATQTDNSGSGQTAVYVWTDGMINKVVEIGDTLDGLTVTGIGTYNRPFLGDGFLALDVGLSDGSKAIYRVAINAAVLAGDYNNSGQVEQGDLDLVLQNWGVDTGVAGVPAGWVNDLPTGQIEQTELDGVLQNWGATAAPDLGGVSVPEPASAGLLLLLFSSPRRGSRLRRSAARS